MGNAPVIASSARIAPRATVVGNVVISDRCVVDYGVVITSAGPLVSLAPGVVVMANAVIRSVGGRHRPAFGVSIGADCLIGPAAVLTRCTIEDAVYVATQVMVFHGAHVGQGCRLGAGCIVHTGVVISERTRVGMRHLAVAAEGDDRALVTSDLAEARGQLARADFFGQAFNLAEDDLVALHRRSVEQLRQEAGEWDDLQGRP